ncbi:MAG TPA: NrfD/PsrC family molybdoenzyme membrane anchor subunit [Chloroflexia bacterium]|jgi:formate-dependent nitrite reductase membrane component NrfD
MDLAQLVNETYKKKPKLGAAHLYGRDAYRDVPILKKPTWNHEVAAYFFFGGISAGAALIGSLAEVFGGERRKELARTAHYVSFATLIPCPPLLIDDLGMPSRFHHMLRVFKPSSPMNLGSWVLLVHGAGATITVLKMLTEDVGVRQIMPLRIVARLLKLLPERLMAGLGVPGSFMLAGYTGVLLGTTSIPVWHTSPLLGGLFMASSISTGAAATGLVSALVGHEGEDDHQPLAGIGLAAGAVEMALLGGYVATSGNAAKPLLEGERRVLLAGTLISLALAALFELVGLRSRRHGRLLSVLAGMAGLTGGAMLRWGVVRAGRASAADREGTLEAMKPTAKRPGWGPR